MVDPTRAATTCLTLAFVLRAYAAENAPSSPPPNILLLMADQFRADCLGADGNRVIRTPNLDRLAAEGARFTRAYSSTPSCTPARSALLTGLSPWRHGMLGYGRVADRYPREMPRMLRDAGYYTLGIGKMHYSPQRNTHGFHRTILDESGREQSLDFRSDYRSWLYSMFPLIDPDATGIGWNDYQARPYALPENLHPTHWTAEVAIGFLKAYRGPGPFFLKVSFARPHSPYDPPERFFRMYEDAEIPAAVVGDWADPAPGNPENHTLWRGNLGPEQVRRSRIGYYGSVSFIDEQIGRILSTLEQQGLLDRTLILFTADHGDMLGDHHLWRKTYPYEASARIPMVIRWPGSLDARRGQVLPQPVELRDVLPTFLDAAGIPVEAGAFDGRSLLELVRGRTSGWREVLDLEHARCYEPSHGWNALTDGRIKYIFHSHTGREQLFDLQDDPGERHDLAADPAHRKSLETWRARLVKHLSERGEPFVRNGQLVSPRPFVLYSPNYPPPDPEAAPPVPATRPARKRR